MREFELFILRKYNRGEMTAIDYSKINILLGEFEQELSDKQFADHENEGVKCVNSVGGSE